MRLFFSVDLDCNYESNNEAKKKNKKKTYAQLPPSMNRLQAEARFIWKPNVTSRC